jgi:hypothetical protein
MAESAPPRRTTGRCLCGAVAYAVDGPLRAVNACHCDECRRVTGSLWHATAAWRDDLTVEDPDARLTWYQSSERARRGFCAACGASLFLDYDGRPYMAITAGTLDKPTGLRLARHIFTDERGDYYDLPDDAPHFPGGPDPLPMPDR